MIFKRCNQQREFSMKVCKAESASRGQVNAPGLGASSKDRSAGNSTLSRSTSSQAVNSRIPGVNDSWLRGYHHSESLFPVIGIEYEEEGRGLDDAEEIIVDILTADLSVIDVHDQLGGLHTKERTISEPFQDYLSEVGSSG